MRVHDARRLHLIAAPNGGDARLSESTADHEPLRMLPTGSDNPSRSGGPYERSGLKTSRSAWASNLGSATAGK
jgi:hypothetical protein